MSKLGPIVTDYIAVIYPTRSYLVFEQFGLLRPQTNGLEKLRLVISEARILWFIPKCYTY